MYRPVDGGGIVVAHSTPGPCDHQGGPAHAPAPSPRSRTRVSRLPCVDPRATCLGQTPMNIAHPVLTVCPTAVAVDGPYQRMVGITLLPAASRVRASLALRHHHKALLTVVVRSGFFEVRFLIPHSAASISIGVGHKFYPPPHTSLAA